MADVKRIDQRDIHTEAQAPRAPYEPPAARVFTEEEILAQLGPGQLYTGALPFRF
jgi:hypothetical protein